MKIRNLFAIVLALSSVGVLHAQPQRSENCDKILRGQRVESFVQRVSCARQAVLAGGTERAFELMAPIYKDATTSKSNTRVDSKAKLGDIVRLRISRDAADRLIGVYGADNVYAALTDALGINPLTGQTVKGKRKLMLPSELANAMSAELQETMSTIPEAPEVPGVSIPTTEIPTIPAVISDQDREKAALAFTQTNMKLFAVNLVLDQMFILGIVDNNRVLCKNLIAALRLGRDTGKIFDALRNAYTTKSVVGENKEITMYTALRDSLESWKVDPKLLTGMGDTKEDLFGEWISIIPAAKLVEQLLKAGIPDTNARAIAEKYLKGDLRVETPELALSKAIMLMRNAYRIIFDPVRGVPFAVSTDERFGEVADIYLALNRGLVENHFLINNDTQFTVQVPFTTKKSTYNLQGLNVRLGVIVALVTADFLVRNKRASAEQINQLRDYLVKAAKIGGALAVGAAMIYAGYQGIQTPVVQAALAAVQQGGVALLDYVSPLGTRISGAFGYVGAGLSSAASSAGTTLSQIPGVGTALSVGSGLASIMKNLVINNVVAKGLEYAINYVTILMGGTVQAQATQPTNPQPQSLSQEVVEPTPSAPPAPVEPRPSAPLNPIFVTEAWDN